MLTAKPVVTFLFNAKASRAEIESEIQCRAILFSSLQARINFLGALLDKLSMAQCPITEKELDKLIVITANIAKERYVTENTATLADESYFASDESPMSREDYQLFIQHKGEAIYQVVSDELKTFSGEIRSLLTPDMKESSKQISGLRKELEEAASMHIKEISHLQMQLQLAEATIAAAPSRESSHQRSFR